MPITPNPMDVSQSTTGEAAIVLKSAIIGVAAGIVVTLYRIMLGTAEKFCRRVYAVLRENPDAYLPLALWILVVVLLALLVGWLAKKYPLISGSGIPQVKGVIEGKLQNRWLSTLIAKFIGGAGCLTAGLSLGREGPSIQLGACVAEGLCGGKTRIYEKRILIAGGASAGLAAAFNAPLSGVIFAFEEIFRALSPLILLSTAVAAIAADCVVSAVLGMHPVFDFRFLLILPLRYYWLLLVLGGLMGLAGAGYNFAMLRTLAWYGKFWRGSNGSGWRKILQPLPIFLLAIVVGIFFPSAIGSGHFFTSRLSSITPVDFLLTFLAIKFAFSLISFASGAPGGIFFPLLVLGAAMGAAFGSVAIKLLSLDPALFINFVCFAMAGFFAAVVRAPITGVILLTEMTGSLPHLLPFAIVAIVAYFVANLLGSAPIYDALLARILHPPKPPLVSAEKK